MRYLFLLALAACTSTTDPLHTCDREKRAVWHALGHEDEPSATLMAQGEWNLGHETYYFLVFAVNPNECKVLRA